MHEKAPQPISAAEHDARLARVVGIAHRLAFVGKVEYRHVSTTSGGAQYGLGPTIEEDLLVVYPEGFRRDAAGDDFSLAAIIAHECGHQILSRHERLRRNTPKPMSAVTEEVLASLVGSTIVGDANDSEALVAKAVAELLDRGMPPTDASQRVRTLLDILEKIL